MKRPHIVWEDSTLFKKTPLLLVIAVVLFVGFNVYLQIKIKNTSAEVSQLKKEAVKPPRHVPSAFTKKNQLGDKQCPSVTAGNPNAPLKMKIFESETCPFCVAENKALDELLPEYGDLFYVELYQVVDCQQEAEKYKISGVPTFVFTAQGVEKPPAYGFLDKGQLTDYICRVSGQC